VSGETQDAFHFGLIAEPDWTRVCAASTQRRLCSKTIRDFECPMRRRISSFTESHSTSGNDRDRAVDKHCGQPCPAASEQSAAPNVDQNQSGGGSNCGMIAAKDEESFQHALQEPACNVEITNDRQRSADRDVRGFRHRELRQSPELGVLAQQMSGRLREIEAASSLIFRLHDPERLLGRVFYADDVSSARFSQMAQAGINGLSFSRCGGPVSQQRGRKSAAELREFGQRRGWEKPIRKGSGRGSVLKRRRYDFFAVTVG